MAAKTDLTSMGRDLVMKALDGLADRLSGDTPAPAAVQRLASNWKEMTPGDRDEIARHITTGVEAALVAIPLAIAATSASRSARKKKKAGPSVPGAGIVDDMNKKDKKDKKKKKKDKKRKKDKKKKKKKGKKK